MELLEKAVAAVRRGETLNLETDTRSGTEVNLNIPALIPDAYVPDIHNRLILYKRIGNTRTAADIRELQVEMIDRFGLLPDYAKNLFKVTEMRQRLEQLGIARLDAGANGGKIQFATHTRIEPIKIVEMVQNHPDVFRLQSATELRFNVDMFSAEDRLSVVSNILDQLSPGPESA